jgi:hypothetical protein
MGVIVARVRFDEPVPPLSSIQEALGKRTGLTCQVARDAKSDRIRATAREISVCVELHVSGALVELEQGISQSLYFFDQVQEALVDLGGCRCDLGGNKKPDGRVPTAPTMWRTRRWSERFLDLHPILTSLIWLGLMVPRGLLELLRRRKR